MRPSLCRRFLSANRRNSIDYVLRVIGIKAKVGEQQWFSAWLCAAALGFDGDEDGIDLRDGFRVFELQHPTLLVGVILIEET